MNAGDNRSQQTAAARIPWRYRLLVWLGEPASINRFYLGMLFFACGLNILGWLVRS